MVEDGRKFLKGGVLGKGWIEVNEGCVRKVIDLDVCVFVGLVW